MLVSRGSGGGTDVRPFVLTLCGLAVGVIVGAVLMNAMSPRTL